MLFTIKYQALQQKMFTITVKKDYLRVYCKIQRFGFLETIKHLIFTTKGIIR